MSNKKQASATNGGRKYPYALIESSKRYKCNIYVV